jgi:hypothetical protein
MLANDFCNFILSCFSDHTMSITNTLKDTLPMQGKYKRRQNDDDECSFEVWYQMSFVTDIMYIDKSDNNVQILKTVTEHHLLF